MEEWPPGKGRYIEMKSNEAGLQRIPGSNKTQDGRMSVWISIVNESGNLSLSSWKLTSLLMHSVCFRASSLSILPRGSRVEANLHWVHFQRLTPHLCTTACFSSALLQCWAASQLWSLCFCVYGNWDQHQLWNVVNWFNTLIEKNK